VEEDRGRGSVVGPGIAVVTRLVRAEGRYDVRKERAVFNHGVDKLTMYKKISLLGFESVWRSSAIGETGLREGGERGR